MSQKSIKVGLDVNTAGAEKALANFNQTILKADKTWQSFAGNLAANLATSALSKFTGALSEGFSRAITEAQNAENEINRLNTALANAGLYSEQTSKSFQDYADGIEAVSTVTGGAVLEQVALLSSMTSLNEQGIKKAADSARDLAAAFNMDVNQATQLVAKAANGNVAGLEKLGLQFVKTKDSAQTYANVLQALEKFQGASEAKSKTFSGQMEMLKNATDKLYEGFGNLIVQNPIIIKAFDSLIQGVIKAAGWVQKFSEFVNRNSEWLEPLAFGLVAAGVAFAAIATKVFLASGAFATIATTASAAWIAITGPVGLVVAGVAAVGAAVYAVVKNWELVKSVVYDAIAAYIEFYQKAASLVGASGVAERLNNEAKEWRNKANAAREAHEAERSESTKTTQTVINNEHRKSQAQIDAEQRLADLRAKRQKEIDDYTAKLSEGSDKAQGEAKLEQMRLQFEQESLLENEWDTFRFEAKLQREAIYLAEKQALLDQDFQASLARIEQSTLAEEEKEKARLNIQSKYGQETAKLQADLSKKAVESRKQQIEAERKLDEIKLSSTASLFGALRDVAAQGGQKSFAAYKTLASSEALISGYLAVQKALASAPPPFNFAAAAAVGIQTGLQLSRINSTPPPAFQNGGIVPGNSFSGDNVLARVNSGEMIFNKSQQQNLFKMVNGMGSSNVEGLLVELIQAVKSGSIIEIEGKQIVSVVRDNLASGRVI